MNPCDLSHYSTITVRYKYNNYSRYDSSRKPACNRPCETRQVESLRNRNKHNNITLLNPRKWPEKPAILPCCFPTSDANAARDPSDGLGNQRYCTYIILTIYHTNYYVYNVTHQNSQTNLVHCIHHHCHPAYIGNVSDNPYYAVTILLDIRLRRYGDPVFENRTC
ncbi:hypothetical protein QTP88_008877 [Uroleucon formosanum]